MNGKKKKSGLFAILAAFGAAALLAVPVTIVVLFFRAYVTPTGSMERTLMLGDHMIAQVRGIGEIHRGEIVLFAYPVDPRQTFIKRVIGSPGDHLRIVNKQLYVNGSALQEAYIQHAANYIDSYRDNFPSVPHTMVYPGAKAMLEHHVVNGELVVPTGSYFVMGDNRDLSLDSRYFGFVERRLIFGKPLFIYLSMDEPENGPSHLRMDRFLKAVR